MGVGTFDSRRPPLPAPTESMDENSAAETEVATNVTTRTDKTSYSIPEDGRPITISTQKVTSGKNSGGHHSRDKSQTSLLIEYFEASKTGDKSRSKPSVRVKVTPSANKKSRSGSESVQITNIGTDKKPSYTRRISLGNSSKAVETGLAAPEGTELSHSSGSNVSGRPPVEIEVLNNESDVSNNRFSRGLMYAPIESNVSSMPPDSMLEGGAYNESELSRDVEYNDDTPTKETAYLKAPVRSGSRSRSASSDRLTQKVMEKLGATSKPRKSSRSSRENSRDYEYESQSRERRRRSSKSQRGEEDTVTGAESSLISSNVASSQRSYRSGSSQASRMTNNPKLLEMVEDTIKRMILPEINAIKEDQKADRKLRKFSESGQDSAPSERETVERRVSKSTSSPNIASKPKVVLNRDGDDPGTVLSRGDSERVKRRQGSREYSDRPSSRRSSGRHSREGSYADSEERLRSKSSKGSNSLRGAAAAGLASAALTSAALKHHDSHDDMHQRRKKRSKSRNTRSRSASINETAEEKLTTAKEIPPMPLASRINDSELTRESILSQGTEVDKDSATPIREVSRGSISNTVSPVSSRTPTRTPLGQRLGMSLSNQSIDSPRSPQSPSNGLSNKARLAKLTAVGLGGGAAAKAISDRHVDADGYGETTTTQRGTSSPAQSVSSLRKNFEDDPLVPQALRPRSAASRSSAGRLRSSPNSQASLRSTESPPTTTKLADSRKQSQDASIDEYGETLEGPDASFTRDGAATPSGETADEWFERQRLVNDRYRDSMDGTTNRDSYQTNPYPQDEHRFTLHTDDSLLDDDTAGIHDVQDIGTNPNYIHTPLAVESAVASLMEPSTVGSHAVSSTGSPAKVNGSYSDRMARHMRLMDEDDPAIYEGSTLSQTMTSQDRWAAIKGHAKNMSGSFENLEARSPEQSETRSARGEHSFEKPVMVASGLPLADDPMPEIGHFDDSKSDVTTNPSIIQGPLGGDATGKSTWPYTPEPQSEGANRDSRFTEGVLAAGAASHAPRHTTIDKEFLGRSANIDREAALGGSPAFFRDEGYATDGRTRSGDDITPQPEQRYGKKDLEEYARAMDAHDLGDDDPFETDAKHTRHFSGNSHGMESPLYDSSTGKGKDRIQSKDVVALMDHLTVRDAQRNARDTEILVTLVRNAAEMRQSLDEMKKFIIEQDKMIMQNTDRNADYTARKVLSGPRPQPIGSPRTPRRETQSEEDIQTKRKGVLRRALKGLTGGKSGKDLSKIEDMLMQILDNVEDLKLQNGGSRPLDRTYSNESLDSYEKLRNPPDSGYEPEGQAGTSSTPSQSGHFNVPPREKQQFHSGYDGRRGSENRVSTVLEDDEDELEPHEHNILSHQFENNERLMTPTQELHRARGVSSPDATPPQQVNNYNSPDKQRKHKSNSSSLFGVPKISRWSKTTASSAAPDPATLDSPQQTRNIRPSSESSRSRSTLDQYDDDEHYNYRNHGRKQSGESLAREDERHVAQSETRSMRSQASRLTRTPSPLIPSEASAKAWDDYDDDRAASPIQEDAEAELDDPKYHAHRNSLLLQHPQPRPGATPRHQNTLESRAQTFDDTTGTNSDLSQRTVSDFDPAVWGSSGTAGLARHRLTQIEPLSPVSMNSPAGYGRRNDDGPLVPQPKPPAVPPKIRYEEPDPEPEQDWDEPQFSNSGFSKGGYYSSPYGSGHLLEPIEEVRYSLETDRNVSPEPQVASAKAVDMRNPARKITGPRPMGSGNGRRSPSGHTNQQQQARLVDYTGTVRRKPVAARSQGSEESLQSDTF